MFCSPCESDMPAMPSSPHRKALERAMSWVKSTTVSQCHSANRFILTAPGVTIMAVVGLAQFNISGGCMRLTNSLREL